MEPQSAAEEPPSSPLSSLSDNSPSPPSSHAALETNANNINGIEDSGDHSGEEDDEDDMDVDDDNDEDIGINESDHGNERIRQPRRDMAQKLDMIVSTMAEVGLNPRTFSIAWVSKGVELSHSRYRTLKQRRAVMRKVLRDPHVQGIEESTEDALCREINTLI